MSAPEMTDQLAVAAAFRDRGWRPFPLDHPALADCASPHTKIPCDGKRGKHPVGGWSTQTASEPTDRMLEIWFGADEPRNIGIATKPSGLFVVDEDDDGALQRLADELGQVIPITYRVRTSRGWHYYFRAPEGITLSNSSPVLKARHMDVRGNHGAGGYVVAAGSIHETGHVYEAEDPYVDPHDLPAWLLEQILAQPATAPHVPTQTGGSDFFGVGTPTRQTGQWDDEPRYGTAVDLHAQYQRHLNAVRTPGFRHSLYLAALDGWRLVDLGLLPRDDMLEELRQAIVRTWGASPDQFDRHIVYGEARQKATASPWVVIERPAPQTPMPTPPSLPSMPNGHAVAHQILDAEIVEDEPVSTWQPVDLGPYLRGEVEVAQATVGLARADGIRLLYPGKEHAVIGEMESGKSWFSLASVAVELLDGKQVLYVHFEEDDPGDTVKRLLLLGVPPTALQECFTFIPPTAPITPDILERLTALRPSLVVLDGQNEAMALHGHGINDPDGAAAYRRWLVKPFTKVGAAVLSCDHVTKDNERNAKGYALGTIHKGNGLNGTLILLENEEAFGIGRRGASRVYITKDRPAQVRQHGKPTPVPRKFFMGMLTVDATGGDGLDLMFWAPNAETNTDGPFELTERWFDILSADAVVPEKVGAMKGKGANAARDIFRVLRYIDDPGGVTTAVLRRAVKEAGRDYSDSVFFEGRARLVKAQICLEVGGSKLAIDPSFAGE